MMYTYKITGALIMVLYCYCHSCLCQDCHCFYCHCYNSHCYCYYCDSGKAQCVPGCGGLGDDQNHNCPADYECNMDTHQCEEMICTDHEDCEGFDQVSIVIDKVSIVFDHVDHVSYCIGHNEKQNIENKRCVTYIVPGV